MEMPEGLLPGDILLYKDGGDFLGRAIQWAEWIDGRGVDAYVHAALFYGVRLEDPRLWIVRQNPGGPAFELVDEQPWDRINIYRTNAPYPVRLIFHCTRNWPSDFKHYVNKHFYDTYAYGEIGDYLGEDLLARLGLGKQSEDLRRQAAVGLNSHMNVCSEWCRIVLGEALGTELSSKFFELLPDVGKGQARPADWPESPYVVKVS